MPPSLRLALAFIAFFAARAAHGEDLVTIEHKTYRDFKVTRVDPDGVAITYAGGIGKVPFAQLSPEQRQRFGYDPVKADAALRQRETEKAARVADLATANAKAERMRKLGRVGAFYRLKELPQAQEEARAQGKPLAFMATYVNTLQDLRPASEDSSAGAATQEFEALKSTTVLVFSDSATENHQEPPIVNAAIHPPDDVHYTPPKVVITDADITKVIAVIRYDRSPLERLARINLALQAIKAAKH